MPDHSKVEVITNLAGDLSRNSLTVTEQYQLNTHTGKQFNGEKRDNFKASRAREY